MIVNITQLLFLPLIFPFCLSLTRSFTTARIIVNFIQKVVKIQKITKKILIIFVGIPLLRIFIPFKK